MSYPAELRYTPTHEWARSEGELIVVGITRFAVEQLTEPTFLELPAVGTTVEAGKPFGVIESVKSTSDLYAPLSGVVVERNAELLDDPATGRKANLALILEDPFGRGWLIKIRPAAGTTLDHLLTAEQYEAQLASAGH
ncbi:MAG: glycine cleavage system protein GcvH [Gemmataceae bacterium]|nr:glycine cleavage system protein GcvH [Gemmataceae bacterium]MCS7270623.1 glycine cleavage system protein GcvH [Gemmataceae bacterium]MDW8243134.1 glycine cleavage system protein GcvH [Thermogemmata sp.]